MKGRRTSSLAVSAPWLSLAVALICPLGACNAILGIEEPRLADADGAAECLRNSDCPSEDDVCLFQVCSYPCAADQDCSSGSRCLMTSALSACVSNDRATCTEGEGECPDGAVCSDGVCRTDCLSDGDCLDDQLCTDTVCIGTSAEHDPVSGDGARDGGMGGQDAGALAGMGSVALGGEDAGMLASMDAGMDADMNEDMNATTDAGMDAGMDAGHGRGRSRRRWCRGRGNRCRQHGRALQRGSRGSVSRLRSG